MVNLNCVSLTVRRRAWSERRPENAMKLYDGQSAAVRIFLAEKGIDVPLEPGISVGDI
jgi:hypothetical protein